MPVDEYVVNRLPDGSIEKFVKPMTYTVPEKTQYVEFTGTPVYMPLEGESFKDSSYRENTIAKIKNFDYVIGYKYAKDELLIEEDRMFGWNEQRLNELTFVQLYNVYTLLSNATRLKKEYPHLV